MAGRDRHHEGYLDLQEALARQGLVSVLIDGHDLNALGFSKTLDAPDRARLIESTLLHLVTLHAPGSGSLLQGRLDLSQVVLFGHSRGPRRCSSSPRAEASPALVPDVTLRGVVSLAPTEAPC